ncbi:MAG: hypothetical protein AAF559_00070 [Pseudomonadota bacterium]
MARWLAFLGKVVAITMCAALSATAYLAVLQALTMPPDVPYHFSWDFWSFAYVITLAITCIIGLPVALLTYLFARRHLEQSPATLAMIAVLAGIIMVLTSYAIGDEETVLNLGIPAFAAAITYGILGWFWIVKPQGPGARGPGAQGQGTQG